MNSSGFGNLAGADGAAPGEVGLEYDAGDPDAPRVHQAADFPRLSRLTGTTIRQLSAREKEEIIGLVHDPSFTMVLRSNGDRHMATATRKRKRAASDETLAVMPGKKQVKRAAGLLRLASDPTRLTILLLLSGEEQHVGAIGATIGLPLSAVSHHLVLLRVGGIIEARRSGKQNIYSLTETGRTLVDTARGLFGGDPAGSNGREAKETSPNGQ